LATWGISLILIQSMRTLFGAQNVQVENPSWMSGGVELMTNLVLPWNRIAIIVFAAAVVMLIALLLSRTRLGLFVRGVTQNRPMASALGVPTNRVDMYAFGLGSGASERWPVPSTRRWASGSSTSCSRRGPERCSPRSRSSSSSSSSSRSGRRDCSRSRAVWRDAERRIPRAHIMNAPLPPPLCVPLRAPAHLVLTRSGWIAYVVAAYVVLVLMPTAYLLLPAGHPLHLSDYFVTLTGKIMCYAMVALAM